MLPSEIVAVLSLKPVTLPLPSTVATLSSLDFQTISSFDGFVAVNVFILLMSRLINTDDSMLIISFSAKKNDFSIM